MKLNIDPDEHEDRPGDREDQISHHNGDSSDSDADQGRRSTPSDSWSSGLVGIRIPPKTSVLYLEIGSTTMVRVPGSLGDSGYHRDSFDDEKDVKIKVEETFSGVLEEGVSPPMMSISKGSDDRPGLVECQVEIKDETTPHMAPIGADLGYGKVDYNPGKDRGINLDPMHKKKMGKDRKNMGVDHCDPPKNYVKP